MGNVNDEIAIFNVTYLDRAPYADTSVMVGITSKNAKPREYTQDPIFVEYMRRCITQWFQREGECVVETPEEYEQKLAGYRGRTTLQLVKNGSLSTKS